MTELSKRELKYFTWYFAISLIATFWAYDTFWSQVYQRPVNNQGEVPDINVVGMLWKMWINFWQPWFVVYATLTAARVIYFLVRGRSVRNSALHQQKRVSEWLK